MRGTVIRRGRKWSAVLDVGVDGRGRRRRQWLSGYERRKDAERALAEAIHRLERGDLVAPTRLTLNAYLRERWLPSIAASVRESTLVRYRLDVERLCGELGHVPLQRFDGQQLDGLYARMLERGCSPASVQHCHWVAHRALGDAVRHQLVVRNVATAATPPRRPRPELRTWSASELRAFLAAVADDRLYGAWRLLGVVGLRRGEALALRWRDVDLGEGVVRVERQLVQVNAELAFTEPKTRRGRRAVTVDRPTAEALRARRRAQLEERMQLGLGAPGDDTLVFSDPLGEPVRPNSLSQDFRRRVRRLGLPAIRLHDLRHTAATLAIEAGVNVKTVSERLGHGSVAFTLDTYAHAVPSLERDAADRVAALLDG